MSSASKPRLCRLGIHFREHSYGGMYTCMRCGHHDTGRLARLHKNIAGILCIAMAVAMASLIVAVIVVRVFIR